MESPRTDGLNSTRIPPRGRGFDARPRETDIGGKPGSSSGSRTGNGGIPHEEQDLWRGPPGRWRSRRLPGRSGAMSRSGSPPVPRRRADAERFPEASWMVPAPPAGRGLRSRGSRTSYPPESVTHGAPPRDVASHFTLGHASEMPRWDRINLIPLSSAVGRRRNQRIRTGPEGRISSFRARFRRSRERSGSRTSGGETASRLRRTPWEPGRSISP